MAKLKSVAHKYRLLFYTVGVTCFSVWEVPTALFGLYTQSRNWHKFPEIRTCSIDWAQLSRFCLKTETVSSLRNVVLKNKEDGVFR
jgi:hypothetical protein